METKEHEYVEIGDAVRTPDRILAVVTAIRTLEVKTMGTHRPLPYQGNPIVTVEKENGKVLNLFAKQLKPGYLNPYMDTHKGFYPHLVYLSEELKRESRE